MEQLREQVGTIVDELVAAGQLGAGQLLVVGCSTSEVRGARIGKEGSVDIAAELFAGIEAARTKHGIAIAYQCCEHLNRALVVERSWLQSTAGYGATAVAAIPVPHAGGSMAAHAYRQLTSPVLVESVYADAGLDIGDTLIGMHLRAVAVPFRPSIRTLGEAHVTAAYTRPKLIGGSRAVYTVADAEQAFS
jgi:uncharacterized protein (TIGR01440 family)